jgi:hypothetical protein
MTYETKRSLDDGACIDLDYRIIDKYFSADGLKEPFEHRTAKAICGHCVVQAACLAEAISMPTPTGVRGGESTQSLEDLRADLRAGFGTAEELALRAIARQKDLGGLRGTAAASLRVGRMHDVPLVVQLLR